MKSMSNTALIELICRCVQGHTSVPAVSSGGAWGTNTGNGFDSVPATIAVDREAGVSSLDFVYLLHSMCQRKIYCKFKRKASSVSTRATEVAARLDKVSDHTINMSHLEMHVHLLEQLCCLCRSCCKYVSS